MRVLLHACCGPCMLEPLDALALEHEVSVVYANPNIHPVEEYERRRDTLLEYAAKNGMDVTELDYDPSLWIQAVSGAEMDPGARCRRCYRLRLTMVAGMAADEGFDAFATTLTISPYQDVEAIREIGEEVALSQGVAYLHRDFRPSYEEGTRRSRELGLYRQNYCGCLLSDIEAREERRVRKERRKRHRRDSVTDGSS